MPAPSTPCRRSIATATLANVTTKFDYMRSGSMRWNFECEQHKKAIEKECMNDSVSMALDLQHFVPIHANSIKERKQREIEMQIKMFLFFLLCFSFSCRLDDKRLVEMAASLVAKQHRQTNGFE